MKGVSSVSSRPTVKSEPHDPFPMLWKCSSAPSPIPVPAKVEPISLSPEQANISFFRNKI